MKFVTEDMDKMVELLRKHHSADQTNSKFSERKVRLLLEQEVDNPKTLILVNKAYTAVLIFVVVPTHFSTTSQLQEICFYSETAGSGFRLLKEAKDWIDAWGTGVSDKLFLSTGDSKVNKMLEKFGMKPIGTIFRIGE